MPSTSITANPANPANPAKHRPEPNPYLSGRTAHTDRAWTDTGGLLGACGETQRLDFDFYCYFYCYSEAFYGTSTSLSPARR